jgi:mobilization protein NikA
MAIERATLLIRCTREEAEAIRHAAKREHRTISGYVLNAVMYRLAREGQLPQADGQYQKRGRSTPAGC